MRKGCNFCRNRNLSLIKVFAFMEIDFGDIFFFFVEEMSVAAFPFDLLHAEIVNYAKESEERRSVAKEQWKKVRTLFIFFILIYM